MTLLILIALTAVGLNAQIVVRGDTVYTMAGAPISDGVVVVEDGKISAVGPASEVTTPSGMRTLTAKVVTPGLIDAHTVIGLSGYLNQPHDQEQLERSAAIQPELRAIDAYNPREELVEWARGYGVTTLHTGHAPGALISGQTMVVKTRGETVDEALVKPLAMIAATLGEGARASDGKSPGTRGKMAAMLREELLAAQQHQAKLEKAADGEDPPAHNLRLEALGLVLKGEIPLLLTAHRAHDILTALRIAEEFDIRLVLDGVAEGYEVLDQILASGFPVIVHPTMARAGGERENLSFATPAKFVHAGILTALQSGFESYVPKSRLVLFEAGVAAAHGLTFEEALRTITIDAARVLGVEDRVGSLEVGKDGDLALYDGDPFEYVSHSIGVVIGGEVVSEEVR